MIYHSNAHALCKFAINAINGIYCKLFKRYVNYLKRCDKYEEA